MNKLIFLLIVSTMSPVLTQAQVNTGGPDFDQFSIAIYQDLKSLGELSGQDVPTVLHDPMNREYKAMMSSDLVQIWQAFHPKDTAHFLKLLNDVEYFITTPLAEFVGPEQLPFKFNLNEIYSPEVGYIIPVISAKGGSTYQDVEAVIRQVYTLMGRRSPTVIYAPAGSPVW